MEKLIRKTFQKLIKNNKGASLAEFAVVTAMMATFVGTSVPKFSEIMELGKERKTIEELDKIIIQGVSFYNETVKTEGRGRFPGQDKFNMGVGGYTDIENLISDLELFEIGNDPNYAPKWISVFGISNPKEPVPAYKSKILEFCNFIEILLE